MRPEEALQAAGRHYARGEVREAEALCAAILQVLPRHPEARLLRGVIRLDEGRPREALADFEALLAAHPDQAEARAKRGNALLALGRPGEALADFDRALALDPGLGEAHANRAAALLRLHRGPEALASAEAALSLEPEALEAKVNRGAALVELRRPAEALPLLDEVLARVPQHPEALQNRGDALLDLERPKEALEAFGKALALRPGWSEALTNWGLALQALGRPDEALAAFDQALRSSPGFADARCCRGFLRLLLGRFAEGWADLEARWERPDLAPQRRAFSQPLWRGEALEGRTLLLHAEQGLGDTIHFARYVPLVAARGGRILLEVQPALRALAEGLEGPSEIRVRGEVLPPFDLHCPLGSLPLAFGTASDSIPGTVPYLFPARDRNRRWEGRLASGAFRVGFVWAGNPAYRQDARRTLPLAALLPLLRFPEITPVALQKELREGDRALLDAHPGLLDLGSELEDFADTAAVIARLDLVISADSAVAHLAGALGKPVWILLPSQPDWRWMLGRDDSPWYPTARLFRQGRPGDWEGVVRRVAKALEEAV